MRRKWGCLLLPVLLFLSVGFGYFLVLGSDGLKDVAISTGDLVQNVMLDKGKADAGEMANYYFLDKTFMGAYEDGQWHSVSREDYSEDEKPFYLKDILAVEAYHLYSLTEKIDVAKRIDLYIADGLGGFSEGDIKALSSYGHADLEDADDSSRWFDLPMTLKGRSSRVQIPVYNFYGSFYNRDQNTCEDGGPALATNATHDLYPSPVVIEEKVNKAYLKIVQEILQGQGAKDAIPNIETVYRGDFDQDGEKESLFVANTRRGDDGWHEISEKEMNGESGVYSLAVLVEKDGSYQVLHNEIRLYALAERKKDMQYNSDYGFLLTFGGAYDLNNDGKFELCFYSYQWEGGYSFVLSQDEEAQWQMVLRANWGT